MNKISGIKERIDVIDFSCVSGFHVIPHDTAHSL